MHIKNYIGFVWTQIQNCVELWVKNRVPTTTTPYPAHDTMVGGFYLENKIFCGNYFEKQFLKIVFKNYFLMYCMIKVCLRIWKFFKFILKINFMYNALY